MLGGFSIGESWLPVLMGARVNTLWYALPLIVAVSFVYSATRHEATEAILVGATRTAAWISGFMLVVFGILFCISALL